MKTIFYVLLPVMLFAQAMDYPDTVETTKGKVYSCRILSFGFDAVGLIFSETNKKMTMGYSAFTRIAIMEKGEVYTSIDGMIYDRDYLNRLLGSRKDITYSKEDFTPADRRRYRPGDHELLFMPTAITMNSGSGYISSYELFFINVTFAVTSRTHIGLFTLFPINLEGTLKSASIGIKQNYVRDEKFEAALWGSYTPDARLLFLGNVFTFKWQKGNFNLGIGGVDIADNNESMRFLFQGGLSFDFGKSTGLMLEYTNGEVLFDDEDFNGLFSIGIRFRGDKLAWDLAGFRPIIENDSSDLFLIPLIKATYKFGK